MTRLLFALLLAAGAAVAHEQCGDLPDGAGLLHVRVGDTDHMCGFIRAVSDGPHVFGSSVPGARVYIARQLVRGPVVLTTGGDHEGVYSIYIEAPASEDFVLSWDQAVGVLDAVPTMLLFKPVKTVGAPCASF
jgi:hypothetical protein